MSDVRQWLDSLGLGQYADAFEDNAIESARKLDFFKVALIPEYVKSPRGMRYDLQIMVKRLHRTWADF